MQKLGQTTKIPTRLNGGTGLNSISHGQQIIDLDNENYRKDRHDGLRMTTNDYSSYYKPQPNTLLQTESNDLTVDYEAVRPKHGTTSKFNTAQTSHDFKSKNSPSPNRLQIIEDDNASDYDQKETDK